MNDSRKALFLSLKRLIHILTAGKREARSYAGMDFHKAEIHLIEMIGQNPGVTAWQIADILKVTKGAVSQLSTKLLNKEVLEKRYHPNDSRVHELYLTALGWKAYEEHERHEMALVGDILSRLEKMSDNDVEAFASVVDMVADFAGK
ncbi:MarR family transcriptional regulator [Nitratidesulfovibrio sp. HK-II]|uniref:MarR family winged helix-turn-helix transcriptional regulator n=1 Tax=Nitratidesulfovibrio sp. HK-II TaxID=2009266 RepID=UPI000E2EE557|nr:MarR family transcriptional regulator [Nitratidesulfovibrio sp. HK-II]